MDLPQVRETIQMETSPVYTLQALHSVQDLFLLVLVTSLSALCVTEVFSECAEEFFFMLYTIKSFLSPLVVRVCTANLTYYWTYQPDILDILHIFQKLPLMYLFIYYFYQILKKYFNTLTSSMFKLTKNIVEISSN